MVVSASELQVGFLVILVVTIYMMDSEGSLAGVRILHLASSLRAQIYSSTDGKRDFPSPSLSAQVIPWLLLTQ